MTPLIPTSFIYPLLSGETCREVAKQTAGVSLADEDAQITRQLDNLVLTWNKLSQSILLDYVDEYIFSPSHEGGREEGVERASWNDRSPASSAHPTGSPPQSSSKKAKSKAKAKAKAMAAAASAASAGGGGGGTKAKSDATMFPSSPSTPPHQSTSQSGLGVGVAAGQGQGRSWGTPQDLSSTPTTKALCGDLSHTMTSKAWRMMAGALVSSNETIVRVLCEVNLCIK